MADQITPLRDGSTPDSTAGRPEPLRPAQIFDPVARALDVIGDRWSLVLVRQLLMGPKHFQDLRVRMGIAPRVLSSRLREMRANGFIETTETIEKGTRRAYRLTDKGRSLEPIVSSIARWWVRDGISALDVDAARFTETSALSVLESLPVLLREDRARGEHVVFEIRLTGEGGGVWTVEIKGGRCEVRPGFAAGADVRYTASARHWCATALGLLDAKDALKRGLLHKEGGSQAIDEFFYTIARPDDPDDSHPSSRIAERIEDGTTRKGDTP